MTIDHDLTNDRSKPSTDADLADLVAGPVLRPGDDEYATEVAGFNLAHRPAPGVVLGAVSAGDVATAVRWAADQGLTVVAQATGHGLVSDLAGTLMITTRRLDLLEIDPTARTARVGAGIRWRAVLDAAAPHGLTPLCGSASGVGVVGYTLGGGVGLLARRYGFAADHVRSLTVVTADGEIRRVDSAHEPDLFWAMRGGKIGLGIVTEIEFDLFPVAALSGGGLFFPGSEANAVLHAWREWAPTLPESVTTSIALLRLPPDPHLPSGLRGQFVAHLRFVSTDDPATAAAQLAPMRHVAPVIMDTVVPDLPPSAGDAVHMDPPVPVPAHDRGLTLTELTAETVTALLAVTGPDTDCGLTLVELRLMGGALSRPAPVPNAVAGRQAAFGVYILGVPLGPLATTILDQVDRVAATLAPWRAGALPNFLGHAPAGEWAAMWSEPDRNRLRAIVSANDPANRFGGQQLVN